MRTIILFSFILLIVKSYSQTNIGSVVIDEIEYQKLKELGQIDQQKNYIIKTKNGLTPTQAPLYQGVVNLGGAKQSIQNVSACSPYTNPVGWPGLAPNDDGSTGLIPIPFTFCFYGTNHTGFYMNNNGNITFTNPVGAFSAVPFPNVNGMLAPFWADVDTRTCGLAYYFVYPDYVHVIWNEVGYFSQQCNLKNTFGVIFSNGNSSVIPSGFNVLFFYNDMQWTTGAASGGVGGFGGISASVGVNRGNNIDFFQVGRFNAPGNQFFGPAALNNQVGWLSNKTFLFSTCNPNPANIPPVGLNVNVCDTIFICTGNTFNGSFSFSAPELNQTTALSLVTPPGMTGVTFTTGPLAQQNTINISITGSAANIGNHTFFIRAIDNFSTPDTSLFPITVIIADNSNFSIAGPDSICEDATTTLIAPAGFATYSWNNGMNNDTITVPPGTYIVNAVAGVGCTATDTIVVTGVPRPTMGVITTNQNPICEGDTLIGALIGSNAPNYDWQFSLNGTNFQPLTTAIGNTFAIPNVTQNIIIQAKSFNSHCVNDLPLYSITVAPKPLLELLQSDTICKDELLTVFINTNVNANNQFTITPNVPLNNKTFQIIGDVTTTYIGTAINDFGCEASDTITITVVPHPQVDATSTDAICGSNDGTITINASGGSQPYLYTYNSGVLVTNNTFGGFSPGTYGVEVRDKFGCVGYDTVTISEYIDIQASFNYSSSNSFYKPGPPPSGSTPFELNLLNTTTGTVTNYIWNFGNGTTFNGITPPSAIYNESGTYTITLIAYNVRPECADTFMITLEAIGNSDVIVVPNIITPNGDGVNDFFDPELLNIVKINGLVYNRWGRVVFSWDDINVYFRGLNDAGELLPDGNYFYVITAEGVDGVKHERKGYVQINK